MTNPTNQKPKYNHRETEAKWVKQWQESEVYETPAFTKGGKKKYILEAFPYPSGDGLHVGHALPSTAGDITSRYYRLNGYSVLHPMGFDAFGLPTENYAIKKGIPPQQTTLESIANFRVQLQRLGADYDWSREINTTDPSYYKWTQWLFGLLYERGLAYKKEATVNWDPIDQTVLANEQVINGYAERSGAKVEQKLMSQWFFKITDYAERLLTDLDDLDWPESTKQMQRNWIGKSEGAEVSFQLGYEGQAIKVFTTAHDTIYGVTFLVIAPEHLMINQLTTEDNKLIVAEYIDQTKSKSNLERTDLNKDKTGVFTGSYAIHPLTGQELPIWVADYVLTTYGTGAVMAVPGEDERDFEFANKYDLPIIYTNHTNSFVSYSKDIKPNKSDYTLINSNEFDGLTYETARDKILDKLIENGEAKAVTNYRLRDWSIGRQRYWGCPIPMIYDNEGSGSLISEENLPLLLPEDVDMSTGKIKPLGLNKTFINSASQLYGEGFTYEGDTMDSFVCSSWYFFRFCNPENDKSFASPESIKQWMAVDQYIIGAEHSTLHLLYARFFTKVMYDAGLIDFVEPFIQMRHQGLILGPDGQKMSKSKGNTINPLEVFEQYGADTLRMYEMFMGPFDQPKPWNTDSIKGVRRFIERVWSMQERVYYGPKDSERLSKLGIMHGPRTERTVEKELQRLTKKIGEDIESYSFNTCVSEFMKFVNFVEATGAITNQQFLRFLILLNPFAPFVTEEIYSQFEWPHKVASISQEVWPGYSEDMLVDSTVKYMVQVNGKVRGEFEIEASLGQDAIMMIAKETVAKWLDGQTIKFSKVVTGKLVSLVVAEKS